MHIYRIVVAYCHYERRELQTFGVDSLYVCRTSNSYVLITIHIAFIKDGEKYSVLFYVVFFFSFV
jgi:hypothetical protein